MIPVTPLSVKVRNKTILMSHGGGKSSPRRFNTITGLAPQCSLSFSLEQSHALDLKMKLLFSFVKRSKKLQENELSRLFKIKEKNGRKNKK